MPLTLSQRTYQSIAALSPAVGASITLRDSGATQGANADDVSLVEMGLDFIAGNLLVICAARNHSGTTGTSAAITRGAATGWNELGFAGQSGVQDARGLRLLWKIAAGTEDVVAALVGAGAAGTVTDRENQIAVSYDIVGTVTLGATPTAQITDGDPTAQNIAASGAIVPHLLLSYACSQSSAAATDQTFGVTPDSNISTGSSSAPALASRLKTKIVTASPADVATDLGDVNAGNGLISGFLILAPS